MYRAVSWISTDSFILSFNLHQNEPLVTNFKSVQWLWKKNIIQEKSFEKGSLQIGHIIQASRCWEICTRVSLLLNWMCSQLMFFCWYVYYGILFSLRFQITASCSNYYVVIIYFTISWIHCIMLNCSVEIWVCRTAFLFVVCSLYCTDLSWKALWKAKYRQASNTRCALVSNKIAYHPDVVGASPVSTAPTKSSFST